MIIVKKYYKALEIKELNILIKKILDLYTARNLAIEKSSGKYISF